MNEVFMIDKRDYDSMHHKMIAAIQKEHANAKVLHVTLSKEEYAEYVALSYCRQLQELKETV